MDNALDVKICSTAKNVMIKGACYVIMVDCPLIRGAFDFIIKFFNIFFIIRYNQHGDHLQKTRKQPTYIAYIIIVNIVQKRK